ncbi:Gibberellin-regulated protein [Rhynchospora pubera]|uniref:Gibberellin-regulated protein n=1 Tax=Rhynchospora pubera TaxID=906938 RepID=A0AAV8H796_9POAL|nr:Gibberellin-regulated protein [Rhynchospora pubera]
MIKRLYPATFTLLLLFSASLILTTTAEPDSGFCDGKCKIRCSKAGVKDRCLKYCNLCCKECNCVPSGTYGNKDECPCYRDKYTGEGKRRRPKCP